MSPSVNIQPSSIILIDDWNDLYAHSRLAIGKAKKFILDTTFTAMRSHHITHPKDYPESYEYTIYNRVRNQEIYYRRVEVIYNKERLETLISRLLVHEGFNYLVRYFDPPPKPFPVFNSLSIDNNSIYLGGFYFDDPPIDAKFFVFIENKNFGDFYNSYWNYLWSKAKPLNDGGRINWEEIKIISSRVGMTSDELESISRKWEQIVQKHK